MPERKTKNLRYQARRDQGSKIGREHGEKRIESEKRLKGTPNATKILFMIIFSYWLCNSTRFFVFLQLNFQRGGMVKILPGGTPCKLFEPL